MRKKEKNRNAKKQRTGIIEKVNKNKVKNSADHTIKCDALFFVWKKLYLCVSVLLSRKTIGKM